MLRLAGALLLAGGAAGLGLCAAGQLRDRVKSLRALEGGLALLARELSFRRAPMPELMVRAARGAAAPACYFFARCRDHLDELGSRPFGQIWREALEAEPELLLGEEERMALLQLGQVLGRYDAGGQLAALEQARETLAACLVQAEEERQRLGRVYAALGVGSGAMLAILLL